jgi:hypothetical protein
MFMNGFLGASYAKRQRFHSIGVEGNAVVIVS